MAPSHALRTKINGHIRKRLARDGIIRGPAFEAERLDSHGYTSAEKNGCRELLARRCRGPPPELQEAWRREGRRTPRRRGRPSQGHGDAGGANPARAERRMGRPESQIHDAGINRSRERQSDRQAARRGSLSVPDLPAGYRKGRQALTPPAETRSIVIPFGRPLCERHAKPQPRLCGLVGAGMDPAQAAKATGMADA